MTEGDIISDPDVVFFLDIYHEYLDAIRTNNRTRTLRLILSGMPFVRPECCRNSHFDSVWATRTLMILKQYHPENPFYSLCPLEIAARSGHARMVALLLQFEMQDDDTAVRHGNALSAATSALEYAEVLRHDGYQKILSLLNTPNAEPTQES